MRLLAISLLLFAGCAQAPATRSPSVRNGISGAVSERELESLIHAEANTARRRSGRSALGRRADLARVAERHSRDMADRDYFSHRSRDGRSPQQRARAAGVSCDVRYADGSVRTGVSENLFQTWVARRTEVIRQGGTIRRIPHNRSAGEIAREVIDGWLDSPGHRRALLDRGARDHGLGVAIRRDGAIYVTQVLC